RKILSPYFAHVIPESAGLLPIHIAGRKIEIDDALVAIHAEFFREVGLRVAALAIGRELHLVVLFFVYPAAGHNGVAVAALEYLIVLSHGTFAPGQRTPGRLAEPGRKVGVMLPASDGFVAWRIIYLEYGL